MLSRRTQSPTTTVDRRPGTWRCNQATTLTNVATLSKREFEQVVYPQKMAGSERWPKLGRRWKTASHLAAVVMSCRFRGMVNELLTNPRYGVQVGLEAGNSHARNRGRCD